MREVKREGIRAILNMDRKEQQEKVEEEDWRNRISRFTRIFADNVCSVCASAPSGPGASPLHS